MVNVIWVAFFPYTVTERGLLLTGRVFSHSLQAVRQAFADQDPEGCGVLGRKAFAAAMESLDLGLSPQVRSRHLLHPSPRSCLDLGCILLLNTCLIDHVCMLERFRVPADTSIFTPDYPNMCRLCLSSFDPS